MCIREITTTVPMEGKSTIVTRRWAVVCCGWKTENIAGRIGMREEEGEKLKLLELMITKQQHTTTTAVEGR